MRNFPLCETVNHCDQCLTSMRLPLYGCISNRMCVGVNAPLWAWRMRVCVNLNCDCSRRSSSRFSAFDSVGRHLVLIYGTFAHFMFISLAQMKEPPTHLVVCCAPPPREGCALDLIALESAEITRQWIKNSQESLKIFCSFEIAWKRYR